MSKTHFSQRDAVGAPVSCLSSETGDRAGTFGVMGRMVEFSSNGSTTQGYLVTPASPGPGVIVIQEWWGLVDHIKDVCERFGSEGFTALAPDLYHGRAVPNSEPDEAAKEMMAMQVGRAAKDLSGAVDELRRHASGSSIGVVGFCMGGGLALILASERPDAVKAVVPCYGLIPWPDGQPDYSKMSAAVLGHYGEQDDFFPPDAARALGEQLRSLGKDATIVVHPGVGHAFFNDTRPEVHDAEQADELWRSMLGFFRQQLG